MHLEDSVSIAADPSQFIVICDGIVLEALIKGYVEWHLSYCKVSPGT